MRERLRREQKKREKDQLKRKKGNGGLEIPPSAEELKKKEEVVDQKKDPPIERKISPKTAFLIKKGLLKMNQEGPPLVIKNETTIFTPTFTPAPTSIPTSIPAPTSIPTSIPAPAPIPTPIPTPTSSVVVPTLVPSAPMNQSLDADCVVMASALNHLHLWVLPHLELIKTSYQSIIFDLTPFAPTIEIQDVAFLDGFDHKGTTVAVAAKNGMVLVLDCVEQRLLYKVGVRREIEG